MHNRWKCSGVCLSPTAQSWEGTRISGLEPLHFLLMEPSLRSCEKISEGIFLVPRPSSTTAIMQGWSLRGLEVRRATSSLSMKTETGEGTKASSPTHLWPWFPTVTSASLPYLRWDLNRNVPHALLCSSTSPWKMSALEEVVELLKIQG